MPHDPSQQKVEQEEIRTTAGWNVPTEVVISPSDIDKMKQNGNVSVDFFHSIGEMLVPDARYSDLEGRTKIQDYAPPGMKALTPVEQRALFFNQSRYLSFVDVLGSFPLISFLGGVAQGIYFSWNSARDRVEKNMERVEKEFYESIKAKPQGEGDASVGYSQGGEEEGNTNANYDAMFTALFGEVKELRRHQALEFMDRPTNFHNEINYQIGGN